MYACPQCGFATNPPDARHCQYCGTVRIAESGAGGNPPEDVHETAVPGARYAETARAVERDRWISFIVSICAWILYSGIWGLFMGSDFGPWVLVHSFIFLVTLSVRGLRAPSRIPSASAGEAWLHAIKRAIWTAVWTIIVTVAIALAIFILIFTVCTFSGGPH
ncbi:MAG: zinc ribbon domain-containing protein [Planctomycetes bacterium]|nr:zinc ribbon domain-containing protein [Planctomycetota bacterium]